MIQKSDPLNLIGKVAVITGAGSGIGLGVAQMLSAYGASVAIVDVSPKSEAAAQELRDAGRNAAFFQCDVTNEQSCPPMLPRLMPSTPSSPSSAALIFCTTTPA